MHCPEFLDRYTEYRDGLVTASRELRRFQRHLAACPGCREYDATVRRGIMALQAAGQIEPSAGFRGRLDARLRAERASMDGEPVLPIRLGLAAALLVAVALAFALRETMREPPQVAEAPQLPPVTFPKPVANAGVPYVTFQDPRASVLVGNPNPYGTALVEPAAAGR
jgi:predicted anti-sigma-YlaC factor YlaD